MTTNGTIGTLLHHKSSSVWTIPASATVFEAIQLMAQKNIGALPVMDGGRLIGIFSERDYTRKVALQGKTSKETKVREIFSKDVVCVTPDETIEHCMKLMTEHRVRHLPVMQNDELVGLISIGDLVNWIISAQNATIAQMEQYIAGSAA